MQHYIIIFFIIVNVPILHAQHKHENESRINENSVPENALGFIKSCEIENNIKWIEEISNDGITYEAKVSIKKKLHSIEFDNKGNIQDVEVLINNKSLNKTTQETIEKQLQIDFQSFKILKIQKQYLGKEENIRNLILIHDENELTINYEIIVTGKLEHEFLTYEYLFNESGTKIKRLKLIEQNSENLDF